MSLTPTRYSLKDRARSTHPARPRTILLVDDDPDVRSALSECLRNEGYEVHAAEHGLTAKNMLHSGLRPSVILLDLVMPVMNGFELLEHIRRQPEWKHIRVLVVSGQRAERRDLKGVFRIFCKPVEFEPLRAAIELAVAA